MERRAQRKAAQKINMRKNISKALLLTGVLCLAGIGGVSAYLTDYDQASNQFTVGKVDISLKKKTGSQRIIQSWNRGKTLKRIRRSGIQEQTMLLCILKFLCQWLLLRLPEMMDSDRMKNCRNCSAFRQKKTGPGWMPELPEIRRCMFIHITKF